MKEEAEATGGDYPAEKTIRNSLKTLGYTTERESRKIVPLPKKTGEGKEVGTFPTP